ncbi:MAG: transporter substrate-binding domain-containing protein [Rhodoplanes sp.]|uniref:transporter substrate-binding domain-containing protein n=1 Tax=Rhodoplanes sp. TaxID=1968906 RepID=UPI0017EDFD71|nr:transporter substrate-binding domain-containing protein [Rhodoplanes sp.]NVO14290.1 transporter substrate-binding domain-containing protein [Rhodoplanes sp.]
MPRQTSPSSSRLRIVTSALAKKLAVIAGTILTGVAMVAGQGALAPAPVHAQAASPGVPIPGFWDPRRRPERPDLRLTLIRFMSEVDYPPFNYAGPDGNPAGFNVDLARAICDELKVACTVQMRRFDTLVESLAENRGDAAIASMAVSFDTRKKVDFSDPYYRPVARFAAKRSAAIDSVLPERVEGKKVAVVAGTAHEAYLRALFTEAELKPFPTPEEARAALVKGEVDLLFGDGYGLAFWLNGTEAAGCCRFVGGPFVESRYFGEGVGIAVKKGNDQLRLAINWALFRLWEKGKFADLWLKYFPVNPF